jgi:Arylsulfotransferase (ASST)
LKKPYRLIWQSLIVLFCFTAGYVARDTNFFSVKPSAFAASNRKEKRQRPPGFWFRQKKKAAQLSTPEQDEIQKLAAIGYLDGVQRASKTSGVITYDTAKTAPGWNYYTSGHAPEAVLMESSGKVLHKWQMSFDQVFQDKAAKVGDVMSTRFWRHVQIFPNGDILAIYEGLGLIKLDKNSRLIWSYSGSAHHDVHVQPDGTLYILTRKSRIVPGLNRGKRILEDFITVLDSKGRTKSELSIPEMLQSSIYAPAIYKHEFAENGDIFHTNSVEVLDGRFAAKLPFLRKGNILVSICFLDMIAVVDPIAKKIVWALSNLWGKQHQPAILTNGNMLVFDNSGLPRRSRVLEVDPINQRLIWSYEEEYFFSEVLGYAQRLANGNTLITDSDNGRAFEITPDKKIVWEFLNPNRAGSNRELVAVIPEMTRLEPGFPTDWLR